MKIVSEAKVLVDLSGQRFGRLIARTPVKVEGRKGVYYQCDCDCGGEYTAPRGSLTTGTARSCGCLRREQAMVNSQLGAAAITKHGMTGTTEMRSYASAKARCQNPNRPGYELYGGRGIKFLFSSFEEFYAHIGPKPTPRHTLDRKKVNGHYELGNVRWATPKEQSRNRRDNRMLTAFGKSQCVSQWAEEYGIHLATLGKRLRRMSLEDALTAPINPRLSSRLR